MFPESTTRLKFNIFFGGIITLFFLGAAGYVTKDILTPFNELDHDSATISRIELTYHTDKTHNVPQYDIYLFDKPYFIRISDNYKKYWPAIENNENINRKIDYYYLNHVRRESVLYNPSQLSIDGKVVYDYGTNLSSQKSLTGLLILFSILLSSLTIFSIRANMRKSKLVNAQLV